MFDSTYCILSKSEKARYSALLCDEINIFLKKIYSKMHRKTPLRPVKIQRSDISLVTSSASATKAWEFILDRRDEAAKGKVGKIVVVTSGIKKKLIRRQRALFIAAEFYTYHAFANHPKHAYFDSICGQSQLIDLIKHAFGRQTSSGTRQKAIRYIVEEIGEHKLAHYSGEGWRTKIEKLERHEPGIAAALGASKDTFHSIIAKQHQVFTPEMLKKEDYLGRSRSRARRH